MGPEDELAPSNILIPPKLKSNTDKLQWREAVRDWALNLNACAAGGDNRAKGAAASLAMTLYRSLEFNKKELVKKSVMMGDIILNSVAGPATSESDQMSYVEKIMSIVAKDSAVDTIKRMVRLNKDVHSCVRKPQESINQYIERFGGPAQAYLNLVNASNNSADSQNFAIVLMINARVSSQTFTNLISSLVITAKHRTSDKESTIILSRHRIDQLIEILDTTLEEGKPQLDKDIHQKRGKECCTCLKAATKVQEHCTTLNTFISLQDAITALEEACLEEKDLEDVKPRTQTLMGTNTFRDSEHRYKGFRRDNVRGQYRRKRGHWTTYNNQFRPNNQHEDSDNDPEFKDLRNQLSKKQKYREQYHGNNKRVSFPNEHYNSEKPLKEDERSKRINTERYFQ